MSIWPLLYFSAFIIYLYLGIYSLNIKNELPNKLFAAGCACLAWWAFCYTFMFSAPDIEAALMWGRLSAPAWCLLYSILLHLSLVICKRQNILMKKWPLALIYLPGIVLLWSFLSPGVETYYELVAAPGGGWSWLATTDKVFSWITFYNIYYIVSIVMIALLFFFNARNSDSVREEKLSKIIFGTLIIAFTLGFVSATIFPLLEEVAVPPLTILIILIPSLGIWYSIREYGFMAPSPENNIVDIVENLKEGVFLLDKELEITFLNSECLNILGYDSKEVLLGEPITSLLLDNKDIEDNNIDVDEEKNMRNYFAEDNFIFEETGRERYLLGAEGDQVPVIFSISRITDRWGESPGYVCTFNDISKLKETTRALKEARDKLEHQIEARTEELAFTNEKLKEEIKEKEKREEKIKYLAYHDNLTGLPNQMLFRDRLKQAILQAERIERFFALLYVDLEEFKVVNDTMGYSAGDRLLKNVAHRLAAVLRKSDTVARTGGDEFLLLINQLQKMSDLQKVLNKVINIFQQPFPLKGQDYNIASSIGVSVYPEDGEDVETLIKNANRAMNECKKKQEKDYIFCTEELKDNIAYKMRLTNGLYRALEREEFFLCYQPQVDSRNEDIIGLETLIRWRHPQLGLVSPGEFIPIAEKTGLINPIGEWVLKEACRQNRIWQQQSNKEITVSVNMSRFQFQTPDLVKTVADILRNTGLKSKHLELEITENLVIRNARRSINYLRQLKEMGIKISIDDFGEKYSSMSYLKELPVDKLKIAMSFIQGISENKKDEAIIRAIMSLSQNLNLSVIAEGVETGYQKAFLREIECNQIQGFYYYKPMPPNKIESMGLLQ